MTIDELINEWEVDANIDSEHLDTSSATSPKLHAKYLRIFTDTKLRITKTQNQYDTLRQTKFRYYRGELTREELRELNWEPWQYNKPLKNEMDEHLKGDKDLSEIRLRIAYLETMLTVIESILGQIKGRDWQIKNILNWRQFMAGQ